MPTINISLPVQLKNQTDALVQAGHYVSFSDAVRTALRTLIGESRLESLQREAVDDYKNKKSVVLENPKDIEEYFKNLDA